MCQWPHNTVLSYHSYRKYSQRSTKSLLSMEEFSSPGLDVQELFVYFQSHTELWNTIMKQVVQLGTINWKPSVFLARPSSFILPQKMRWHKRKEDIKLIPTEVLLMGQHLHTALVPTARGFVTPAPQLQQYFTSIQAQGSPASLHQFRLIFSNRLNQILLNMVSPSIPIAGRLGNKN